VLTFQTLISDLSFDKHKIVLGTDAPTAILSLTQPEMPAVWVGNAQAI
jgi:hypothetical protein